MAGKIQCSGRKNINGAKMTIVNAIKFKKKCVRRLVYVISTGRTRDRESLKIAYYMSQVGKYSLS
jgi:hypothetical protein